jgi:hypothetical protein
MIEIKMTFATIVEAQMFLEHGAASARPPLTEADAAADLAGTPRPDRGAPAGKLVSSETAKPGKPAASTLKVDAVAKPTADPKPAAVPETPPPASIGYEAVAAAIGAAVTDPANKPAVKALLGEFDAKDGSGKATNGQKLKTEDYPAFLAKLAEMSEALG